MTYAQSCFHINEPTSLSKLLVGGTVTIALCHLPCYTFNLTCEMHFKSLLGAQNLILKPRHVETSTLLECYAALIVNRSSSPRWDP